MRSFCIYILIAFIILPAQVFALGANPLTLTYAGGAGQGDSYSKSFSENKWDYKYQYHVLVLSGDTPQGSLFSQIQLEERDYMTGLGYAKLSLSGSTYSIDIGDNVAQFSDITLNSLSYQGASVTLKPSSSFQMTVLGGSRGNGSWGADVRRDTRPRETFTGVRTVFYPVGGLGLNATYLTAPGGADVLAYGSEYVFRDLKFAGEYGSALEGKAFRGEIRYQTSWLTLGTIYRDVDDTYVVPFDYVGYKGMKGTYSTLGIRPWSNMNINIQSDSYIDRLNGDPDLTVNDTRGDISYNLSPSTNIGYSGWRNDRSAYDRGGISEGELMYITQQFVLLTKNAIYYRYQPTWFESLNPSEESSVEKSYSENKNISGINIALFDTAHLNYEIENTIRLIKDTNIDINTKAVTVRMDVFDTQIMSSPFYIASTFNHRRDIPDRGSNEKETITTYEDATLKFIPNKDLSCFITAKVLKITAPEEYRLTREQHDLSFGMIYSFNTSFYLK